MNAINSIWAILLTTGLITPNLHAQVVVSGSGNDATGVGSVIVGGNQNTASALISGVISGAKNTCSAQGALIIGGFQNTNAGFDSILLSGADGEIAIGALRSVIVTGSSNAISGDASNAFIGAGESNQIGGTRSGIFVGSSNSIPFSSAASTDSAILCGRNNLLSGQDSAVFAGIDNIIQIDADFSAVGGQNASSNHDGCFVWNSSASSFGSTADGQFLINVDDGVGIGVNNPSNALHVENDQTGDNNTVSGHTARIQHSQANFSSVLALQVGDPNPTTNDNYITFFDSTGTANGNVSGNGSNGAVFNTSGADYAEYLVKDDKNWDPKVSEIVAIRGGKVVQPGEPADRYMVITGNAAVSGNAPIGQGETDRSHELVSFIGQVPVQVSGPVAIGDYILATPDGIGIARSADQIAPHELALVVGRAWEADSSSEVKQVNTAVGLDQTEIVAPTLERLTEENRSLRDRLEALERRLAEANL